jgi:ABC-type glycerol-3-phosphate transport system permease component
MTSTTRKFHLPVHAHEWRYFLSHLSWRSLVYAVAIFIALVSVFPFLWTISTSLKQGQQILALPPRLIPDPIFWQNYKAVFEGFGGLLPVDKWLLNSLFLTSSNILGEVLFASIAGFGFARFRFRGRNLMFIMMLGSAVVPMMVRLLPQYGMFASWGWTNTYLPLILPNWFGGVFLTFLFRQYFVTIPKDLDDAARIDGAGNLQIFFRIILPLSRPMLATGAILVYFFNWNNFLGPFIYLHSIEKYPLAVGLQYMRDSGYQGTSKEPLLAAFAILMAIPLIAVFFLFQRYFVQGLNLSASKE